MQMQLSYIMWCISHISSQAESKKTLNFYDWTVIKYWMIIADIIFYNLTKWWSNLFLNGKCTVNFIEYFLLLFHIRVWYFISLCKGRVFSFLELLYHYIVEGRRLVFEIRNLTIASCRDTVIKGMGFDFPFPNC